jgi:hypothetical protein
MMGGKAKMLQQMMQDPAGFVDTKPMQGLTLLLAQEEEQLQEAVDELVETPGADVAVDVVDPEDRSGQLRAGLKAVVNGDVPEQWVREYAALEHADEAAQYAGAHDDAWQGQCAEWAERWRENGLEGTDAELAEAFIRSRYGVPKDEFEAVVVEWDDDREKDALRQLLAGPLEDAQEQIRAATAAVDDGG